MKTRQIKSFPASVAPFGGVGHSGMGRIQGKFGFDTFTHEKPVALRNGIRLN